MAVSGCVDEAKRDDGFTLIELLVVMIILGMLAAIAIPTFLDQRRSAISSGQVADLRSVANEVESFMVEYESYPDSVNQVGSQVSISSTGTRTQRVTVDNSLSYALNPAGSAYCLRARNPKAAGDRFWISDAGGLQPSSTTVCPF